MARTLLHDFGPAYRDVVQQAPAVQQAVLSVLLDRCLARLASDCSPETLAGDIHPHTFIAWSLAFALHSPCVEGGLVARLLQPQGAVHLQRAAHAIAALPARCSDASPAGTRGAQHLGLIALLRCLCKPSDSISLPASTLQAASWVYVEALPGIATMLAGLAADGSIPALRLAVICFQLLAADSVLLGKMLAIRNDSQLAAWAAAADATLRLMPTLLQLHERCQCLDDNDLRQAPLTLSQQCLALLMNVVSAQQYMRQQRGGEEPAPTDGQLAVQLWLLHTRVCRLLTWVAADSSGARCALLPSKGGIAVLLLPLSGLLEVLMTAGQGATEHAMLR